MNFNGSSMGFIDYRLLVALQILELNLVERAIDSKPPYSQSLEDDLE